MGLSWTNRIHSVLLLLSPSRGHESDTLVMVVCTTKANGGKSESRTSTTLSGRGQGRSAASADVIERWSGRGR
jgi:hypothetical protein